MERLDNIFKRLTNERMPISEGVWSKIAADQKRKSKKGFWWFAAPAIAIIAISAYMLLPFEKQPVKKQVFSENTSANSNPKSDIESVMPKSVEAIGPIETEKRTSVATPSIIANAASIKSIKTVKPSKSPTADITPIAYNNPQPDKNNLIADLKTTSSEKPETENVSHEAEKVKIIEAVNSKDTATALEELNEKKDFDAPLKPLVKKKSEKLPRNKYIRASAIMARTYRKLTATENSHIAYRDLRNLSEISAGQTGLSVIAGMELNKHTTLETGLLYLPNKISSSYTWQQIKTETILDSTKERKVYDTASSQWITVVDSFSHAERRAVAVKSNGDLKFNYIRIPFYCNYEFRVGKMGYYVGGGFSLNVLITSSGTIRNYVSADNSGPVSVNEINKTQLSTDLISRAGIKLSLMKRTDLTVGISGGYNLFSAFDKNYPLKQHNFWYGIEAGLRWSLL